MKSWCKHDCFRVNCFVKEIIFAIRWTRQYYDIELFSSRLYHQKIAFVVLLIFKYFFVVRHVRNSIIWHDCSNQLFHQMNCIYKTLNASRHMIIRINCIVKKIAFVVLLIFKYVFVERFVRYLIFCQCRYFMIDTWIQLTKLFFLAWIFSNNETKR